MKGMKISVLLLSVFLFISSTLAQADYRDNAGPHGVAAHHGHHYYHNGRWYRHGWFGIGVAVPVLSAGVYVDTLPSAYTPVVVQGTTYYYGDNTYFAPSPQGGYVVVAAPR